MAVRIRMTRVGRTNQPHYRIGVYQRTARRNGRCLETLGHFDPRVKDLAVAMKLDADRVRHWLQHGATPSPKFAAVLRRLRITK